MSHFTWMNSEEFCFGGDCGVSFFFMLSGFVLCHAHGKEVTDSRFGHKRFIFRQLSKIYPLHIATLLATILIGIKAGIYPGIGNLALNVTLLQSWIPDPDIHFGFNSVSWFLSDIMFFYLMFPSLVRCTMKAKKRHLTFGIAAVAAAYICILIACRTRGKDKQSAVCLASTENHRLCNRHNSIPALQVRFHEICCQKNKSRRQAASRTN